jgi:hypothetical protein
MKSKLFISILGFTCSLLVAVGFHIRSDSVRHSPRLVPDLRKGLIKGDFVRDIQRIHDEVYDPIRPVSKEGSFLLTLEMAAYAAPGVLISSLLSPTFLPAFTYVEQSYQNQRSRLPLGASLPPHIESAAQLEGFAWGVGQGIAFYLPFILIRKKKTSSLAPKDKLPLNPKSEHDHADEFIELPSELQAGFWDASNIVEANPEQRKRVGPVSRKGTWLLLGMAAWCAAIALIDFSGDWVYDLSKWGVCAGCLFVGYQRWTEGERKWLIPLGIVAVLFNPIAPIRFDSYEWRTVDWIVFSLFIGYAVLNLYESHVLRRIGKKIAKALAIILLVAGLSELFYFWFKHHREELRKVEEERIIEVAKKESDLCFRLNKAALCFLNPGIIENNTLSNEQLDYRQKVADWEFESRAKLDGVALNPEPFFKDKNLSFSSDPKRAQMLAMNSAYMDIYGGGAEVPLDESSLSRQLFRQRVAQAVFNGKGAKSEEEFHSEIVKAAQGRKRITVLLCGDGNYISAKRSLAYSMKQASDEGKDREQAFQVWSKREMPPRLYESQLLKASDFMYGYFSNLRN